MNEDESPKRTVRLPFAFGEVVYHRARRDRLAGVVIAFVVAEAGIKTLVRWGAERLDQDECFFSELTTEYEPFTEVTRDG